MIWAVFILTILVIAPTLERVEYGRSLHGPRTDSRFSANLQGHAPIVIIGNTGFSSANGVTGGSGKIGDPYIIDGWQIDAASVNGITIVNTTSYFTVQGVSILSAVRAIYLDNATNGIIQRSVISNSIYGILLDHSKNISVQSNIIANSGSGSNSQGIELDNSLGVSIAGNRINSISEGLALTSSPASVISNNTIWYDTFGVDLLRSPNAIIINNNVSYSRFDGISLSYSPYANIKGNILSYNNIGVDLGVSNACPCPSPNATLANNFVDWNGGDGIMIPDNTTVINNSISFNGGTGIAVSGENTTISSNTISFNGQGGIVNSASTSPYGYAATIENNTFTDDGISLSQLDHRHAMLHPITQDNLVNSKPLYFYEGCSNLNINARVMGELILMNCRNIQVTNLEISHSVIGMEILNVSYITITNSSFNSNTQTGIYVFSSRNVTITGNDLSNNPIGLDILEPPNIAPYPSPVTTYHNNFFFDQIPTGTSPSMAWDNGYPSGGNYWSNYKGVDNCSGPQQNICPNPDGIGDIPLRIGPCCNDADHYPLMKPYLPKPDTSPPTWLPNVPARVTGITQNAVTLYWITAADDVAVMTYEVYQGTARIATISSSPFNFTYLPVPGYAYTVHNLTPNTVYDFTIVALDAGNYSASSPRVTIQTQTQTTPSGFIGWFASLLLQYWYLWVLVGGGIGSAPVVFLKLRRQKRNVCPVQA